MHTDNSPKADIRGAKVEKKSISCGLLDCFGAKLLAMTNKGNRHCEATKWPKQSHRTLMMFHVKHFEQGQL
ncbi:MAG: hypothetical protein BGO67_08420 [Alphaproteobacteria bacterium 41-28]|nr:MAG: hypothetical protein BGO67_08420 [Alphaproteobacteria bacterium 41-28]